MKVKIDNFQILILDSICDDYYNLWEPYSELKQLSKKVNCYEDDAFKNIFKKALLNLYKNDLIIFFQGILFNGDEKKIDVHIDIDFLNKCLTDWKSNEKEEIRVTTSNKGDEFLKNMD